MNYLRVHAAAKKRSKARRDILGLLKNAPLRRSKIKKKPLFTGKPFGIFGKALSFKVLIQDSGGSDNESPGQNRVIVIPIEQVQSIDCAAKIPKRKNKQSKNDEKKKCHQQATEQLPMPTIQDAVNQQSPIINLMPQLPTQNYANNTQTFASRTVLSEIDPSKVVQTTRNVQTPQIDDNFIGSDQSDNEASDNAPVGFDFEFIAQSNDKSHKILSFDMDIVQEFNDRPHSTAINGLTHDLSKIDGSIGFASENQIGASFADSQSNLSSIKCERIRSHEKIQPDYSSSSLNTPVFSEFSISPLINSEQQPQLQTPTEFIGTSHIDTQFDRNSFLETFECPKLTIEMVIERKRLAARCAFERLFPDREMTINSTSSTDKSISISQTCFNENTNFQSNQTDSRMQVNESICHCSMHNQFDKPKESQKLTKQMITEQKRLAARHSLDRLFRETNLVSLKRLNIQQKGAKMDAYNRIDDTNTVKFMI